MAQPEGPVTKRLSAWGVNFLLSIGANSRSRAAGNAQEKGDAESRSGRKGDRKAQLYRQSTKMEAFFIYVI